MSVLVAAPILLAITLVVSGWSKTGMRGDTEDAMISLRIPLRPAHRAVATLLPFVEIALPVLLFSPLPSLAAAAAIVTTVLMLAYLVIIARALTFDEKVECSCFGSLASPTVSRSTLWRNILLTALGLLAVFSAVTGETSAAVTESGWQLLGWSAALLVAIALTVLVLGGIKQGTQREASASGGHGGERRLEGARDVEDEELLDYERQAIPYGALQVAGGATRTLTELASTRAVLLLLVSQGCGSCVRVLEKLPAWRAQLEPLVQVQTAFTQPLEKLTDTAREQAGENIGFDVDRNLRRVFNVNGTPAAVLLGADGYLAGGPVVGGAAVTEFFEEIIEQLAEAAAAGEIPASAP